MYTAFAFFEYLTVVSNIAFHSLTVVDFDHTGVLMVDFAGQKRDTADQRHGLYSSRTADSDSYSVSHVLDRLMVV